MLVIGMVQYGAVAELLVCSWWAGTPAPTGLGLGSDARAKQSPFAWTASSTDVVQELKNAWKDKQKYLYENGSWRVLFQGK